MFKISQLRKTVEYALADADYSADLIGFQYVLAPQQPAAQALAFAGMLSFKHIAVRTGQVHIMQDLYDRNSGCMDFIPYRHRPTCQIVTGYYVRLFLSQYLSHHRSHCSIITVLQMPGKAI